MFNILFNIIIYPVRLLIECIYAVLSISIFKGNIGIAIAGLSLAVNLLCLPLYTKAEKLQQAERDMHKRMAKRVASIKKCFKGDEQYMILSMYYRENHYHPIMALRNSLSLLIQLPFFIAAYSFLSSLDSLHGKSLHLLTDLSAPDGLLYISGFSVNILPVMMTVINVVAGLVYSKGFPLREKAQLYLVSLIFLALLYNSPSALVLYWTMNNIFSLLKNILFKIKDPLKIVYFIGFILCVAFMAYVLFFRYNDPSRAFRNKTVSVLLFLFYSGVPFYWRFIKYLSKNFLQFIFFYSEYKKNLFILSSISLWVLIGCYIPFNLVASDPVQFASIKSIPSPYSLLSVSATQAAGLLLFWPVAIYFLAPKNLKSAFSFLFAVFALGSFVNFFIFYDNYGIISQNLEFTIRSGFYLAGSLTRQLINISVIVIVAILACAIIYYNKIKYLSVFMGILVMGTVFLSITKLVHIKNVINHETELQKKIAGNAPRMDKEDFDYVFTMSRTKKNVFIIMLDGAINSYFPLALKEKPELLSGFEGFVYYPNTCSLYKRTLFGTPPLFGGYEYTTYNMNERKDEKMRDKHNEAMLLLPEIFTKNNFKVMITDMPYVNYEGKMDPEFYTKRGIKAKNIIGLYNDKYIHEELGLEEYAEPMQLDRLLKRNILMFSLLEVSIYSLRDFIYQNGKYWSTIDYSLDSGVSYDTIGNYAALHYLPRLTEIIDENEDSSNNFSIMVNNLTHDHVFLQYPDYDIEERITEHGKNFFANVSSHKTYHVNIASYLLLAEWFDWMRSENLWDNTRIIIVSDHGDSGLTHPEYSSFQNNYVIPYNPILLFKDFGANGEIETNYDFMTNADVPFLALLGIVDNPVNPFTGKILAPEKEEGVYIFTQGFTNTELYSGTTCLEDNSVFYHVRDSIFDSKNWNEIRYKDFKNN